MQDIEMNRSDGTTIEGPHKHDYYTILMVLEGTGVHHIDFKQYPIYPGTIFFVSPGQVHQVELSSTPKGYVLLFTEDFLLQNGIPVDFMNDLKLFYACDEVKAIHPDKGSSERLTGYITQIMAEYGSEESFRYEGISAWLKLFLIECKRIKSLEFPAEKIEHTQAARLINDFKEKVEAHYARKHKVNDYAAMMAITSNYLNEVIKSETGMSAKEFIQNRIILEVKRLAVYSEKTSKEVAYELGFDDPGHFSKFVKLNAGMNFSELKEHLKYQSI